jgi:hypothetical protein
MPLTSVIAIENDAVVKTPSPLSLAWSSLAVVCLVTGCPSDDGDSGGDSGADEHGTDEHGTDEHGTDEHGTDEHGTDEHGTDEHGVETAADDPAAILCSCLLANCHDPYHTKWGEDEMMSQQACLMEADALPMNGSDIEMGNFIECRQHFCDAAASDDTVCANALGDAVCM